MYWFLVNRRMTVHSHTMFACKPVNLVLRHRNLYPYANAGIDLSGKANPFDTRFHSHLRGEPDGTRTHSPYLKRVLRYRCATGSYWTTGSLFISSLLNHKAYSLCFAMTVFSQSICQVIDTMFWIGYITPFSSFKYPSLFTSIIM